ncbi:C-terminal binding protein [Pseudomonas silvicola]|nr:C-terminal binding protein [Pseudomonas silvicola]
MFKVVKTDGMLLTEAEQLAQFGGLPVNFIEATCLTEEALIEACADADAVLALREPFTARVMQAMTRCKIISRFGVGLDTIDVPAATAAGIRVANVPDSNFDEVSTHALAMLLALLRRLPQYNDAVRDGHWDALGGGQGIRRPSHMTLGLVGFGRIGRDLARKAAAVGFQVCAFDPHMPASVFEEAGVKQLPFEALLTTCDVLSLHVPLIESTANLLDAEALQKMRKGSYIINVSRGGLIDEPALAAALACGHIAGAGIDTLASEPPKADNPLLLSPNLLLSPHAAHYSQQSYAEVRTKAFASVAAVLRGEEPLYPVN